MNERLLFESVHSFQLGLQRTQPYANILFQKTFSLLEARSPCRRCSIGNSVSVWSEPKPARGHSTYAARGRFAVELSDQLSRHDVKRTRLGHDDQPTATRWNGTSLGIGVGTTGK